ncbi:MAG: hypothetical protein JXA91_01170 [Candidatus Thermoplasmatota archaeon]|nr:hypothetical protein [Candidatus Thermoplasmatota archaeon]
MENTGSCKIHSFYREWELTKPVSDYFKKEGYVVKKEVKIGYCRADLVAFRNGITVAIELKLAGWKKAITQARNYQLGADYVYIASPLMKVDIFLRKAKMFMKNEGIGLLAINEKTCNVIRIIEPKKSKKVLGKITLVELERYQNRESKYLHF